MAGRQLSAEQGGKSPNSRWRPPLTVKAGPVREVRAVEGFWLRAHHLIDLEEGTCCLQPFHCYPHPLIWPRWDRRLMDRQTEGLSPEEGPVLPGPS